MVQEVFDSVQWLLGLNAEKLNLWQMGIRSVVVYIFVVALTRLSDKRLMTRNSPFDFVTGIVLGTVAGNAIIGSIPFIPALGSVIALVAIDWIFADLSFRYDRFGAMVKGKAHKLVENGEIQWDGMKRGHISLKDLMSVMRTHGVTDLSEVKTACLERSGLISIIRTSRKIDAKVAGRSSEDQEDQDQDSAVH